MLKMVYFKYFIRFLKRKSWSYCRNQVLNTKNKMWRSIHIPYLAFKYIDFFSVKKLYLEQIELVVTTKCSLKCKKCANYMQYYQEPYTIPIEEIKQQIASLFEHVDYICEFLILGGEPFIRDDMDEIINAILSYNKVDKIKIVTNGTIIPPENVIQSLKNKKVMVKISNYGRLSRAHDQLISICIEQGIQYRSDKMDWIECSSISPYTEDETLLAKQFLECDTFCHSYLNGIFHFCPRSTHIFDLLQPEDVKSQVVDLLDPNEDCMYKKKRLKALCYETKILYACKYCLQHTPHCIPIPTAEQTAKAIGIPNSTK